MAWLMHELTHQWQYQHVGIIYLAQAIVAPTYVYCNANETPANALTRCSRRGENLLQLQPRTTRRHCPGLLFCINGSVGSYRPAGSPIRLGTLSRGAPSTQNLGARAIQAIPAPKGHRDDLSILQQAHPD